MRRIALITWRRLAGGLLATAAVALCLGAGTASAATIEVNSGADDGAGAACTLRDAIASADGNAGSGGCAASGAYGDDTITFGAGITGTINTGGQLNIDPSQPGTLNIQGPGADSLAIDVNQHGRVISVSANANSAANAVTISGLELRDGLINAADVNAEALGAGVLNSGQLTLDGVDVHGNEVEVAVTDPVVAAGGGGVANRASLVVDRSTISDNHVSATVTNSLFALALAQGGGIRSDGPGTTIRRTTVSANSVTAVANGPNVNNSAPDAMGGGIGIPAAGASLSASIESTTAVDNDADAVDFGAPASGSGGGVAVSGFAGPSLSVNHSTIAANSVSVNGATAANLGGGPFDTVENTVIAEPQGGGTNCSSPVNSAGHNLADDASCGFTGTGDQQGTPAGLQPLGDYGGPTLTRRPAPGSALIDGGTPGSEAMDQRGLPRTVDYDTANATGGDGTDIGAVEIQGAIPTSETPGSPNAAASPQVQGTSEPGSTVHLFGDTSCTTEVGSGAATLFAGPGITAGPFGADTTTSIRANAVYGTATSPCSATGVSYTRLPAPPPPNTGTPGTGTGSTPPPAEPKKKCKKGQKRKKGKCVRKKRKKRG